MFGLYKTSSAIAIIAVSLFISPVSITPAYAAEQTETAPRQFGAKAGEIVSRAQQAMNDKNWSAADMALDETLTLTDLSPYERATVYQMKGAVAYETGNHAECIRAFEAAIDAGGLLHKEKQTLRVNIGQLMVINGDYAQGAARLEHALNGQEQIHPNLVEMITQAWVQAEDYEKALPWVRKWYDLAATKNRKHFDLMNFVLAQTGRQEEQISIVKKMTEQWPQDRNLWDMYRSLLANNGQEREAFEVYKTQYRMGMVSTEQELLKLVQYHSFYDIPFWGAKLLETEMNEGRISKNTKNLKNLSNLLRQAREYERAIPVLRQIARLEGEPKTFAELGEALIQRGDCSGAGKAFRMAREKGYPSDKLWMLLGTCQYEDAQKLQTLACDAPEQARLNSAKVRAQNEAVGAFEKVSQGSALRRDADKWTDFIHAEQALRSQHCDDRDKIIIETCFLEIRRAYDQSFIEGITISEPCQAHKAEYDKHYRKTASRE